MQVDKEIPGPKTFCFQLYFDKAMIAELDDFRFENRIHSRAEAVRRLIREGLDRKAAQAAEVAAE